MAQYFLSLAIPATRIHCARAFAQSLAVVVLFVIATGLVFLPAELDKLQDSSYVSVAECQTCDNGRMAIMLVRETPTKSGDGVQNRIVLYDLLQDTSKTFNLLPNINPNCIAVTPAADRLFFADENGSIIGINLRLASKTGALLGRHIKGRPTKIVCSGDGRTLVSLDEKYGLYAWNLETWELRWCNFDKGAYSAVILPDSQSLICQRVDGDTNSLVEMDIATGRTIQTISTGDALLSCLAVSPDGRKLAGLDLQGNLTLLQREPWSITWREQEIPGMQSVPSFKVASFSPDSDLLVAGFEDGKTLALWDVEVGKRVTEFDTLSDCTVGGEFLDQNTLFSWNKDGTIRIWDLTGQSVTRRIELPAIQRS